jgi:hypothetical protein
MAVMFTGEYGSDYCVLSEESASPTYKNNSFDPQKRRNCGKSSMHIPINEEHDLDIFYWIPKLHNNPYLKKGMLLFVLLFIQQMNYLQL